MTAPEIPDLPAGPVPLQTWAEVYADMARAIADAFQPLIDAIALFNRSPLARHWMRGVTATPWHFKRARVQLRREGAPHPTPEAVRRRAYDLFMNKHG